MKRNLVLNLLFWPIGTIKKIAPLYVFIVVVIILSLIYGIGEFFKAPNWSIVMVDFMVGVAGTYWWIISVILWLDNRQLQQLK